MAKVMKGHTVDWFGAGVGNVSKSGEVYKGGPWVASPAGDYKKAYEPGSFGKEMSNEELRKFRDKARRNSSIGKGINATMAQLVNTERTRFAEAEMRARGMSF